MHAVDPQNAPGIPALLDYFMLVFQDAAVVDAFIHHAANNLHTPTLWWSYGCASKSCMRALFVATFGINTPFCDEENEIVGNNILVSNHWAYEGPPRTEFFFKRLPSHIVDPQFQFDVAALAPAFQSILQQYQD